MSFYFPVKGHTGKAQYFISKEVKGIIVYCFLNTQKWISHGYVKDGIISDADMNQYPLIIQATLSSFSL